MNYLEYKQQFLGKSIDVDGAYGAQCFDNVMKYMTLCWGVPYMIMRWTGGVRDLGEHFSELFDTNLFQFTYNSPTNIPPQGAVFVMTNGQFGHTGIIDSATSSSFISLDQNWGSGVNGSGKGDMAIRLVTHDYSDTLGWITPKNNDSNNNISDFHLNKEEELTQWTLSNGVARIQEILNLPKEGFGSSLPGFYAIINDLNASNGSLLSQIKEKDKEITKKENEINLLKEQTIKHIDKLSEAATIEQKKYEETITSLNAEIIKLKESFNISKMFIGISRWLTTQKGLDTILMGMLSFLIGIAPTFISSLPPDSAYAAAIPLLNILLTTLKGNSKDVELVTKIEDLRAEIDQYKIIKK